MLHINLTNDIILKEIRKENKMAKNKTVFVCSGCGYESPKWMGKCPACNEWNSFYEEKVVSSSNSNSIKKKYINR